MSAESVKLLFIMPLFLSYGEALRRQEQPDGSVKTVPRVSLRGLPNGPLSIGTYIKKFFPGAEIKIFDAGTYLTELCGGNNEVPEDYGAFVRGSLRLFKDFKPDIIAFSCLFNGTFHGLREYAAAAAEMFPGALITAGGHLAAALPGKILCDSSAVQAVCFGEGEIPFVKLCQAFTGGRVREYLEESVSWYTPGKIKSGFRASHEFIENPDEIPPLDPEMLVYKEEFFRPNPYVFRYAEDNNREIMLFPTRGCPNHCIFCASQNVHGHRVRRNTAERVKKDILYYNEKYGVTCFVFFDDSFLYDRKSAIEVLNFIGDNGFTAIVPTPAFFAIDDEVAAAFAHARVACVEVSIENGNQETLTNIIHKPSNLKRAEQTIKCLRRHGIISMGTVLIGFPGETIASMMKGLAKLKTMDLDMFLVRIVTPLPGSELWDMCVKNGYFSGELMPFFQDAVIETPDFSREKITYLFYSYHKWLNFDFNRYYRAGKWKEAYDFFSHPIFSTSFVASYYLALCARKMGRDDLFLEHRENYLRERKEETQGMPVYQRWAERELREI